MQKEQLVWIRPDGGRLQIAPPALEAMLSFIQDTARKYEAGGVLLGRYILNSPDVVVDTVTTPMMGDRRRRSRFFRDRYRHQNLIDRAWSESGGTCTYLGEWHTHPEPDPTPSMIDLFDWRRKLMVDEFSGHLFFVIVGTSAIRAWEGRYRRMHLYPLKEGY